MAQKEFTVKQKVNANGVIRNAYATVVCEESEINSIVGMLEGEYTVMAEHSKGGSDAQVNAYNLLTRATFKAEGKANMQGAIFASNGGLVIKNGLSVDEITNILSLIHPFKDDSTKKPDFNTIKPVITAGARVQA